MKYYTTSVELGQLYRLRSTGQSSSQITRVEVKAFSNHGKAGAVCLAAANLATKIAQWFTTI